MITQPDSTINDLARACYINSKEHGFYDEPFNFGEKIALIHSELSEALESYREHGLDEPDHHVEGFSNISIELADACIRIFDLASKLNLNIGGAISAKHLFNQSRPYKHGKKL